ncbi:MAG: UDP-N-acetylglucosamine 2-epimerase, partial [Bacteroidetes bacterium]|nr:UDP-N-acetylglucosamine 2-epimerase [Bacteroidota bacterium]
MKILTVIGARPQFIKAAAVNRAIAKAQHQELILHTGQHYDDNMSKVFFQELGLPEPLYNLNVNEMKDPVAIARMMEGIDKHIKEQQPDVVLVYGDTNSTLAGALAAKQNNTVLAHVEAGLRSYNRLMPEEINRIVTDQISDLLFCPTQQAMNNLEKEGYPKEKVVFSGDVMYDNSIHYSGNTTFKTDVEGPFILSTVHRLENVADQQRLTSLVNVLNRINADTQVLLPAHPRTRQKILEYDLKP